MAGLLNGGSGERKGRWRGRGWYLTIRQMVAVWVGRDVMEAREHKIKIRKIQDLPDLLFLFPSDYQYGKKSTYLYALFISISH